MKRLQNICLSIEINDTAYQLIRLTNDHFNLKTTRTYDIHI